MATYTSDRYERYTELELEFVKEHWCYGNLHILAEVMGRGAKALQQYANKNGISFNRGKKSLTKEEYKIIWDKARYKTSSPIVRDTPQAAVKVTSDDLAAPLEETKKPETGMPEATPVCPCHVDDTIITKRIGLLDGGELWVCARCGREIGIRHGSFQRPRP